ncbi:MAG: ATP-binding protein [Cellvibrionales bacterium]|nr:ATP-binding protein [Cellvibrionales bacterium]
MFTIPSLFLISLLYFFFIIFCAIAAKRHWIPKHILNHPMTFALSLGGYTGTWAISGALSVANTDGYLFLSYFFGTAALFIFSPLMIKPLFHLTKRFRLGSLADLLSFRYKSSWAGLMVASFVVICILPLMAIQFDKLAETAVYITQPYPMPIDYNQSRPWAWFFCVAITATSLFFSYNQINHQSRENGLVFTTALQSLIKLVCFLLIGGIALFAIFDGPKALEGWLISNPSRIFQLNNSIISNNARTLIIIFFAAALAFPHLFHLTFVENPSKRAIDTASWAFPAYLLLISLPILPILWAAQTSGVRSADYLFALGIGKVLSSPWVVLAGFFCMLSAAATLLTVIAISASSMFANHLILPYLSQEKQIGLFNRIGLVKQGLIIALVFLSMMVLEASKQMPILINYSFAAFSAACQFLPGILALLYWPRGNRVGLVAGIIVGFICWFIAIVLPMVSEDAFGLMPFLIQFFSLAPNSYFTIATTACLGINMLVFGLVSFLIKQDAEESYFAALCSQDNLSLPIRYKIGLQKADDFIDKLSDAMGINRARQQVIQATNELGIDLSETRPFALRLLRRQIEANLSGFYGPTVSRQIISTHIPYIGVEQSHKDIRLIEQTLDANQKALSGLSLELDLLRRYHRNTIESLPIGVCTFGKDLEILLWNQHIETLSGQSKESLLGAHISEIQSPWKESVEQFLTSDEKTLRKVSLTFSDGPRWFNFFKTTQNLDADQFIADNQTVIIEETTETVMLENEVLHSERLASIGRLAAGVAHEIGNPVTGIACLAQNLVLDSDAPEIAEASTQITEQTERIKRILQILMNFSHAGHVEDDFLQPIALYNCVEDAIHLLSLENKAIKDQISNHIHKDIKVLGDAQRLLQVFINLLNNAIFASHASDPIILTSKETQTQVWVYVKDSGSGIDPAIHEKIFEPFFTTKETGQGTGLGLSLVYSIIEDHHGSIKVTSPIDQINNRGTCFTLELPKIKMDNPN